MPLYNICNLITVDRAKPIVDIPSVKCIALLIRVRSLGTGGTYIAVGTKDNQPIRLTTVGAEFAEDYNNWIFNPQDTWVVGDATDGEVEVFMKVLT